MKNRIAFTTAAALAIGGLSFAGAELRADDDVQIKAQAQVDNTDNRSAAGGAAPQLPAGIQRTDKDDSEDIKDMLGSATEAALTKDGFDDLIERFVDADRNRLGDWDNQDVNKQRLEVLNGRIAQIRNDFKAKYDKDFDIDHKVAFGNQFQGFAVVQGEIENPALLSNWPLPNKKSSSASGDAGVSAKIETNTTNTEVKTDRDDSVRENLKEAGRDVKDATRNITGGDTNLNKGRNVAVVVFPAKHGLPEVTASLIHEMPDNWKIDVPDHVNGDQLYAQLLNHLTKFGEMKDQWPADVNEAHRMAAHHVLAAVYDVSYQGSGQAAEQK